jgi:hypothetical protein
VGRLAWLLVEPLVERPFGRAGVPRPNSKSPRFSDLPQAAAIIRAPPLDIRFAERRGHDAAYRENRSALDAVQAVYEHLQQGYREVVDADLSGYFDSRPTLRVGARHAELMNSVARRISDKALLHLLKQWLIAPVEETGQRGRIQRTTRNKDERRGTPQGALISPLLANLYMRRFVLGWTFARKSTELRDRLATIKLQLDVVDRSHDENADLAVKVFGLSQTLREQWLTADYAAKRRILEIVPLDCRLVDVNLVPTIRKPFDALAEGLVSEKSRGDWI